MSYDIVFVIVIVPCVAYDFALLPNGLSLTSALCSNMCPCLGMIVHCVHMSLHCVQ